MSIYIASGNTITYNGISVTVPENWTSEVQFQFDQQLVMTGGVRIKTVGAKTGDRLHYTRVHDGGVYDKIGNVPVTIEDESLNDFTIDIDRDKQNAFMVEDIAEFFSKIDVRESVQKKKLYALARDIDRNILGLRSMIRGFTGGAYGAAHEVFSSSNGLVTGTPAALTRAVLFGALEALMIEGVPEDSPLVLYCSPAQYLDLKQITEFTSTDYVPMPGMAAKQVPVILDRIQVRVTNLIGRNSQVVYGIRNGDQENTSLAALPTPGVTASPWFPTQSYTGITATGLPVPASGADTGSGESAGGYFHSALLCHPDWAVVMKSGLSTKMSYENMYQSFLTVNRQMYGMNVYEPRAAMLIHSAA